jgi:hypothetical protein
MNAVDILSCRHECCRYTNLSLWKLYIYWAVVINAVDILSCRFECCINIYWAVVMNAVDILSCRCECCRYIELSLWMLSIYWAVVVNAVDMLSCRYECCRFSVILMPDYFQLCSFNNVKITVHILYLQKSWLLVHPYYTVLSRFQTPVT